MIVYRVSYDLKSETQPKTHVHEDTLQSDVPLTPREISDKLSVNYAWIRGETNQLTNLRVKE